MTVEPDADPTPEPAAAIRMRRTRASQLPLAAYPPTGDGATDYAGPMRADLDFGRFSTATLRAILDEVALQGHLLAMSFAVAVEDRLGPDAALAVVVAQGTGAAGVAAERLKRALELDVSAEGLATLVALHPAFLPRSYVNWRVAVEGDGVLVELGACEASAEHGVESWITALARGHQGILTAVAAALDQRWVVRPDPTPGRWRIEWTDAAVETAVELPEVSLAKLSAGATFEFTRPA